jgi:hypothetical protein
MAQHDYVIDNQTAPNFRADLNNALAAIVSTNSGSSEPSTTYANMMWYDTTANILKMRNEADDTWINLGTLDQVANTFAANILLASQAEAEAGTENTKAMTPLRVEQAIADRFNVTGTAPTYAVRAWVNFNGTGTVAIRDSGNVSSITDNGTGNYTVNFTTAMPDANYAVVGTSGQSTANVEVHSVGVNTSVAQTTTACRVLNTYRIFNSSGGPVDNAQIQLAFLR